MFSLKKGLIKKIGPKQKEWKEFRDQKLIRDRDEDKIIICEDYKIGLPHCFGSSDSPDLHHIVGRDTRPDLYFDESNLVWLMRECHRKAHDEVSNQR